MRQFLVRHELANHNGGLLRRGVRCQHRHQHRDPALDLDTERCAPSSLLDDRTNLDGSADHHVVGKDDGDVPATREGCDDRLGKALTDRNTLVGDGVGGNGEGRRNRLCVALSGRQGTIGRLVSQQGRQRNDEGDHDQ